MAYWDFYVIYLKKKKAVWVMTYLQKEAQQSKPQDLITYCDFFLPWDINNRSVNDKEYKCHLFFCEKPLQVSGQ